MPIYKNNKNILQTIKEKPFALEKDIQELVEKNLMELFGIEFLQKERVVNGLRIDTLGFNPETKSFVIIEYKRGSSFSIVDQGFSYLSLMLNNKSDFILEYNEKNKEQLKRTDVDWSQTRIIFVSPHYSIHQVNAINFKNTPFELWEIKRYENDTVLLNQIKNDDSQELMPNIEDKSHVKAIKKEAKEYTEEQQIGNRKKAGGIYFAFKEGITEIYPEIIFDPKAASINLKHSEYWRVIVYLNIYSDKIRLTFTRSLKNDYQDSRNKLLDASEREISGRNQKLTYLDVSSPDDIQYAMGIFQQAYKKFKKEFIEE